MKARTTDERFACFGCGRRYFVAPRTKAGDVQWCKACVKEGTQQLKRLGLPVTRKQFAVFTKRYGAKALRDLIEEIDLALNSERN
jgi:hypothetical protein